MVKLILKMATVLVVVANKTNIAAVEDMVNIDGRFTVKEIADSKHVKSIFFKKTHCALLPKCPLICVFTTPSLQKTTISTPLNTYWSFVNARMNNGPDRPSDISSIQPDRLIKYRVSDDGLEAEALFPGLWHTDFDQKNEGLLTVYAITKLIESTGWLVLENGLALYPEFRDKEHGLFLVSMAADFTRRIHEINAKTVWGKNYPLYVKITVIHVGSSSMTLSLIVYEYITGDQLAVAKVTCVYVDNKRRQPVPFPSYMDKLKKSMKPGQPSLRLPTPDIPATAFTSGFQAYASDIDFQGHVNQPIFLKWCDDAATEAALKGHYTCLTGDLSKHPKSQIVLNTIGEGSINDKFVVHTWQDEVDNNSLRFVVTIKETIVCIVRFSYYSNDSKL